MKKAIVIYSSKHGSTKQYAEWIAEEVGCEAIPFAESKKINLYEYDLIVYGGWIRGSGIVDFDNMKKRLTVDLMDKMIIFGVGIANESLGNYQQVYDINYKHIFRDGEKNPTLYILSGKFDPNVLGGFDKILIKTMTTVLKSGTTPDGKDESASMQERLLNGVDLVDRDNIKALVKEANKILSE